MRNTILCLPGLFFLHFLAAAAPAPALESAYQQCTASVQDDPAAALRTAERWMQEHDHPSAYHCRALALFALKRYAEAARELERLSTRLGEKNLVLWGNVLRQAAKAWELADDKAKAIVTLTGGIQKTANLGLSEPVIGQLAAELLLDRSVLYAGGGRELFALQDLDQALSLAPDNPRLLFARARLFIEQDETALAKRDLDALKAINPAYPGAASLRKKLGD